MKQHITKEQVYELIGNKQGDWVSITDFNTLMGYEWNLSEKELKNYSFDKCCEDTAKWTTIGKMIEILSEKNQIFNLYYCEQEICLELIYGMGGFEIIKDNLCDALWEAVKTMLNEEV